MEGILIFYHSSHNHFNSLLLNHQKNSLIRAAILWFKLFSTFDSRGLFSWSQLPIRPGLVLFCSEVVLTRITPHHLELASYPIEMDSSVGLFDRSGRNNFCYKRGVLVWFGPCKHEMCTPN